MVGVVGIPLPRNVCGGVGSGSNRASESVCSTIKSMDRVYSAWCNDCAVGAGISIVIQVGV